MFGINTVEIMKGSLGFMTNEFPELTESVVPAGENLFRRL